MTHELIRAKAHSIEVELEAMMHMHMILKKIEDAVITHEDCSEDTLSEIVEVGIFNWWGTIVLNVMPDTNKDLFYALKRIMTECGVKEYDKENNADYKKKYIKGSFKLFTYKTFKNGNDCDYKIDVMFRGDLPDSCKIEYEESYEEVNPDNFIVQNGKVMKKEVTVKVTCEEPSMLRLAEHAAA